MPRASARFVRQHPWGCLSNALFHQADARPSHTGASPASIARLLHGLDHLRVDRLRALLRLDLGGHLARPAAHPRLARRRPARRAFCRGVVEWWLAFLLCQAYLRHADARERLVVEVELEAEQRAVRHRSRLQSVGELGLLPSEDGVEEAVEEGAVEVRVAHHDDRVGRRIFDLIDKRGDAHAHLLVRLRRVAPPRLTHLAAGRRSLPVSL
mmetsp:Transcript_24624/g.56416  ORF Transcript_24624/g.56416 Transcript_24624/m.56416 type:complete len:211 (-) Transcript_24624:85-717(-)